MGIKFIKNEAPGYCVLISFYQFVKALNMSCQEFLNHLPKQGAEEIIKTLQNERFSTYWDNIYKGRVQYEALQKQFFKGAKDYDMLDPFTEAMYKYQCGLDIKKAEDKTKTFDDDFHEWENKKLMKFFEAFDDRCEEVPFFIHFCNFMNSKFTYPDHIYVATMKTEGHYTDDRGKEKPLYRIKAYNSDNQQGVVEEVMKDPVCPLVFGHAKGYPDYGELPEYLCIKPGGKAKDLD